MSVHLNNFSGSGTITASSSNSGQIQVSPASATVTGTIQTTIVLSTLFGDINCTYQAHGGTISGTASNDNQSLSFTNQQFDLTDGPSTCFANGFFTASYGPVLDTSQDGSPAVYVN